MSFLRNLFGAGPKPDPVRQVLRELLGTEEFTYDVLGILGLERRYEVVLPAGKPRAKLYLNVLAFGTDCAAKVAALERKRAEDEGVPQVLAWRDCEPLLNGNPYILADRVI